MTTDSDNFVTIAARAAEMAVTNNTLGYLVRMYSANSFPKLKGNSVNGANYGYLINKLNALYLCVACSVVTS